MQMDPAYFPAAPTEQLILDTWVCSRAPQFTCSYRLLLGPGVLRMCSPSPRPEPLAQMRPIVLPLSLPRVGDSCPSAWQQSAAHPYLKSTENTALLKFNLLPPQRSTWKLSSAIFFMQAQAPHRASWTKAQLTGHLSRPQTPIRGSSSPRSLWEMALRWQNRRTGAQLLS